MDPATADAHASNAQAADALETAAQTLKATQRAVKSALREVRQAQAAVTGHQAAALGVRVVKHPTRPNQEAATDSGAGDMPAGRAESPRDPDRF